MIQKLMDSFSSILSAVMAACLAVMVVLVFGNVVMRYAFNSGLTRVADRVGQAPQIMAIGFGSGLPEPRPNILWVKWF